MNEALASKVKPEAKPYYGAKVKQIEDMFKQFVPAHFASKYEPAAGGCSGSIKPNVIELMRTPAENARAAAAAAEKAAAAAASGAAPSAAPSAAASVPPAEKRVWKAEVDDERFCRLYAQLRPQSTKQWKSIADQMWPGCLPRQCKSALRKLEKNGKIGGKIE